MLLIIAVLAFLSAAILLFWFSKRHNPELLEQRTFSIEPPNARPLFAPSDADLRREANENEAREIARREYRAKTEARGAVDAALSSWRKTPNAGRARELIRVAAICGLEGDLARAAEEILSKFHESGIDGLTKGDLAAFLDSHIRLLPVSDRSSGAIFWLKQEVAGLRRGNDIER